MAPTFKKQIETMTPVELEQLKDNLFQELSNCPSRESWRTLESLNMKMISIGRKIIQVAAVLYSENSDDFKKCKEQVYALNPRYRKRTEEEKNEKVIYMISNELESEARFVSSRARRLGYRSRYPRKNEEKQYE